MADTGWLSPSSFVDIDRPSISSAWSNETNAYTSNNSYAINNLSNGDNQDYLFLGAFGASVPTGATINGIEVSIEAYADITTAGFPPTAVPSKYRAQLYQSDPSDITYDKETGDITTETTATLGGASDLWGYTLSAEDVNDADFGVTIKINNGSGYSGTNAIDHVQIKIYYTEGDPITYSSPFPAFRA